jgi:hypothetical protein
MDRLRAKDPPRTLVGGPGARKIGPPRKRATSSVWKRGSRSLGKTRGLEGRRLPANPARSRKTLVEPWPDRGSVFTPASTHVNSLACRRNEQLVT